MNEADKGFLSGQTNYFTSNIIALSRIFSMSSSIHIYCTKQVIEPSSMTQRKTARSVTSAIVFPLNHVQYSTSLNVAACNFCQPPQLFSFTTDRWSPTIINIKHTLICCLHLPYFSGYIYLGWQFSALVASFVAQTKLLNIEPG